MTFKGGIEFHRFWLQRRLPAGRPIGRPLRLSIADFQNGKIAQTIDTRSNATATGLQAGNPVIYANGVLTGQPSDADGRFRYLTGAAFIQDTWDPLPGLDITGGLRLDQYWDGDKPVLNPFFTARYGFTNQATFNGKRSLDPRLSVGYNWEVDQGWLPDFAPTTDVTLRGGIGKLSGGILAVWITDSYDTTGVASVSTFGIPALPPRPVHQRASFRLACRTRCRQIISNGCRI